MLGAVCGLLLGGCASLSYYSHLASGQMGLLGAREPVARVLARLEAADAGDEDPALAERLRLSQRVLDFAEAELDLEVGGRYRSYVDLEREAVVWNLFAAPALGVEAHTWCYPLVGCAPYRGYFNREMADAEQARMAAKGFDTYLGAVSAYSTLGWFDDPLLSTFINLSDSDLVELLIHELAHSRVWVRGDVTFNESFASFVGRAGLRAWHEAAGSAAEFEAHLDGERTWRAAEGMLLRARETLAAVYGSALPETQKLERKGALLAAAGACLAAAGRKTGNDGYRRLGEKLNNAYLASLSAYADRIPAFAVLFDQAGGSWPAFYLQVLELAGLGDEARAAALEGLAEQHPAAAGDDEGADEIECEAFSGHGLDAEVPGAEHDYVGGGSDREHEGA